MGANLSPNNLNLNSTGLQAAGIAARRFFGAPLIFIAQQFTTRVSPVSPQLALVSALFWAAVGALVFFLLKKPAQSTQPTPQIPEDRQVLQPSPPAHQALQSQLPPPEVVEHDHLTAGPSDRVIESIPVSVAHAYATFDRYKTLTFHVNRGYSTISLPAIGGDTTPMVDKQLRDNCLAHVVPKVEGSEDFYFHNLSNAICYISENDIQQFTRMTKLHHPDLKFVPRYGLVDNETDIQLMDLNTLPGGIFVDPKVSIEAKVSAWIAKLIPSQE